jgi:tRNA threonylcarbamoyladenosine modification (KEOPS) complex  Pcc1 subunit
MGDGDNANMEKPHVYTARIDLPSPQFATIVATALSVDSELRPALVDRTVTVDGSTIAIRVAATELRVLRSSALSILDYAIVSLAALEAFGTTGQPFAKQKEHGTEAVEAG